MQGDNIVQEYNTVRANHNTTAEKKNSIRKNAVLTSSERNELLEQIDHDEFRNDIRRLYRKAKGVRTSFEQ